MAVGASGPVSAAQIMETVRTQTQSQSDAIDAVRDDRTSYENKQLAYNNIDRVMEQLQESVESLGKSSAYTVRKASTSNDQLVTASADNGAAKTSFQFTEITQLAKSAMVTSSAGLSLSEGTGPVLTSDSDINVADFDPNVAINSDDQGVSPAISSGTFTINGATVTVKGTDTLYSILTKINNTGTGVSATFDAATDTVTISGTSAGSSENITFSSGNTNIFEALNMTTVTEGTDPERNMALDQVAAFSGVSDGFFNINGYTFSVDASNNTLEGLIGRVNATNCGASMFFDPDTGKVTITNEEEGQPLILENDTSGFLSSINVVDLGSDTDASVGRSVYVGQKAQFVLNGESIEKDSNSFAIGGVNFNLVGTTSAEMPSATVAVTTNYDGTVEKMEGFVSQFNATINVLDSKIDPGEDGDESLKGDSILKRLMTRLRSSLLGTIENPGSFNSLADIGFSFEKQGGSLKLVLDSDEAKSKLEQDETSVRQLFAYDNDADGILDDGGYAVNLSDQIESYTRSVSGFFYKRNDQMADIIDRLDLKIYDMEEDLKKDQERVFNEYVQSITSLQRLQAQQNELAQTSAQLTSIM